MDFDPAADPWGAAMLGAAVVVALALFVLIAALLTRTPKRAGKRILGLGCFLFLGTAVGGTWQRIREAEAKAAEAAKPPRETVTIVAQEPPGDEESAASSSAGEHAASGGAAEGDAGDAARDDDGENTAEPATGDDAAPEPATGGAEPATDDDGAEPTADGSAPEPADDDAGTTPEPETAEAPDSASGGMRLDTIFDFSKIDLTPPDPLPSDPEELGKAVSRVLGDVRGIADEPRRCGDARTIAEAWAAVRALPPDTPRVSTAVSRLESCRKKTRNSKAYWVRRKRIDTRNEFANELPKELRIDDSYVFVNVRGQTHEKIRIGGKSVTVARAKSLLAHGMQAELEALGFVEATFASGTDTLTKKLDPPSDSDVTDKIMARWGLDHPLTLEP